MTNLIAPLTDACNTYTESLWTYNPKKDNEHTHRTALENLLQKICETLNPEIQPRQEIKDNNKKLGVPDFSFVHNKNLGTIGLLENKKIGLDIHKLIHDPQIKKYRKRNENIILTNYHDWLLLRTCSRSF